MKPLIPQTVYVPSKSFHGAAYEIMCSYGLVDPCVNKEQLYIFTKEELIELLTDTFDEGYNGGWCMSREDTSDSDAIYDAQTFINNLLNQQ